MNDEDATLQFSLLKLFLWTAIVAMLLGILKMFGAALVLTVCMLSWVVAVGVIRVTVAPKTATGVSLALGVIAATTWGLWVVEDLDLSHIGATIIVGAWLFGALLGLVMAALVETVLRVVDAVDEFLHKKRSGRGKGASLLRRKPNTDVENGELKGSAAFEGARARKGKKGKKGGQARLLTRLGEHLETLKRGRK